MNEADSLDLFVFHRSTRLDLASLEGGAKGIVVDFETRGKTERQQGFDTLISKHDWQDLREIKHDMQTYVICRINSFDDHTATEVMQALDLGVDEILIPMVRKLSEVTTILRLAKEKARVSVMIETMEAIKIARQLDQLPLARVFVGLNDLCICRGSNSIFSALADGTVESIREMIKCTAFGFGGLTIPDYGSPLPVEYFLHEMTRLDCQFTFLRRSFFQDTADKKIQDELPKILSAIRFSASRDEKSIKQDKSNLTDYLGRIL